jgi:phage regulator Rha-like protein
MKNISVVVKSMSSLEMAELCEKRHDSVKRTIETLSGKGVISHPQIVNGKKSANGVVTQVYYVGERDSYIVVAQLSPEFTARLVDRWQELERNLQLESERKASRQQARLEAPLMTKSLADMREREGKESPPHIFSNEHNMIYRIVLGFTAKKYKEENGIGDDVNLRDVLSFEEIKALEQLQKHNTTLIELDFSFEQRKTELTKIFMRNHSKAMIAEIERLNA